MSQIIIEDEGLKAIMADPQLAAARRKLSFHEIRLIVKHARVTARHECPKCNKPFESENANFCPYGCGSISSNGGYVEAFYELADLMEINAQARSPQTVWEQEMKPRLIRMLGR